MVKNLTDLINEHQRWTGTVGELRLLNSANGYQWCAKGIGYTNRTLTLADYKRFFDRSDLNDKWLSRYNQESLKARKPYAWLQIEIDQIYSFHKCFAMRHQTRLQYYRHDLSQKLKRTKASVDQAHALLEFKADVTENI